MIQAKFSIQESHLMVLEECRKYGFKDKSALVRAAIDLLAKELRERELRASADKLADMYEVDEETREWTDDALGDWPS